MSELRQQMIDAVLVCGFSPRIHKSYLAAISKTIIIEGVSATELVRLWPTSARGPAGNLGPLSRLEGPLTGARPDRASLRTHRRSGQRQQHAGLAGSSPSRHGIGADEKGVEQH